MTLLKEAEEFMVTLISLDQVLNQSREEAFWMLSLPKDPAIPMMVRRNVFRGSLRTKNIIGKTTEESTLLSHVDSLYIVENTEVESSGDSAHELLDGSGIEGSGFYSNLTGRWWWFDDDEEDEEADESSWADWILSKVSNTVKVVVLGAAEMGEFIGPVGPLGSTFEYIEELGASNVDFSGSDFGSGEGRSLLDVVFTEGSGDSDDGSADAYQSINDTHMTGVDKLFQGNVSKICQRTACNMVIATVFTNIPKPTIYSTLS